jgi:hypothetical protein
MKRRFFLFLVAIFLISLTAYSTEQIPDRLIIEKDTIYLKSFPLDYLRAKLKIREAPFDYGNGRDFPHTGCYRGYVATWQIIDELLTLKEVQKIDTVGTQLNVVEYLSENGYNPKIINGYVVAEWYSDTLKYYDFFIYHLAYKFDEFYVSKDYLREGDKKIELIFENGKLIKNDITPIEAYKLGDTLSLNVYYYTNWLTGYKSVLVQGIIRENNRKKVKLEITSLGTDKKSIKRKLQKEIDLDYIWVNPRYCKRKE